MADFGNGYHPREDSVAQVVKTCADRVRSGMSDDDVTALQASLQRSYPEREQFDDFRVRVSNYLLAQSDTAEARDFSVALINAMFGKKFGYVFSNVAFLCAVVGITAPNRYNLHGIFFIWRQFDRLVNSNTLPALSEDDREKAMKASKQLGSFLLGSSDLGIREDILIAHGVSEYKQLLGEISDEKMSSRQLRAGALGFLANRLRDEAHDAGGFGRVLEKRAEQYEAEAGELVDSENRYPRFVPVPRLIEGAVQQQPAQKHFVEKKIAVVEVEQEKEVHAPMQRSTSFVEEAEPSSWVDQVREQREREMRQQYSPPKVELPPREELVVSLKDRNEFRKEQLRQKQLEQFARDMDSLLKRNLLRKSEYTIAMMLVNALRDTPPTEKDKRRDLVNAGYAKDCINDAQYKKLYAILFG